MSVQITPHQAQPITALGGERLLLRPDAAVAWDRACKKFGKGVLLAGALRSVAVQEVLFRQRYVMGNHRGKPGYTNDVREWNGRPWTRRAGQAAAAVPGTSNHGTGCAVDVKTSRAASDPPYAKAIVWSSWSDKDRAAFLKVAAYFGWSDDEGRLVDEVWHLTYYPDRDKYRNRKYPPGQKLTKALIRSWQKALGTPQDGVISKPFSSLLAAQQRAINSANRKGKFLDAPLKVTGRFENRDRIALVKYLNWLNTRKRYFSGAPLSTTKDLKSSRRNSALKKALAAGLIRREY